MAPAYLVMQHLEPEHTPHNELIPMVPLRYGEHRSRGLLWPLNVGNIIGWGLNEWEVVKILHRKTCTVT